MEGGKREFGLCFRELLATIVAEIGGSEPHYISRSEINNVAAVVVPAKVGGLLAYYFEGGACDSIERSEETAAEKAVLFLVRKKRLRILDFNLRKMEENKTCGAYYKAQKEKITGSFEDGQVHPETQYSRTTSIGCCMLLKDVLDGYGIHVTDINCLKLTRSQYVCLFGIRVDPAQMEWLMGSIGESVELAKQNLARKALRYLQPLLNFEVIDLSYHRMRAAQIACALNREEYLAAKEDLIGAASLASVTPSPGLGGYRTPQDLENQIQPPNSPPPAPKKHRLARGSGAEGPPDDGPVGCLFEIPDELGTIFTVTGRM